MVASSAGAGWHAGHMPARRVRNRRRRLRPALERPGEPGPRREPAPVPEAWARMLGRAPGPGRESEPALVSGRQLGPARRCGVPGGGSSARLIRAAGLGTAALAGAWRSARGGACAAACGVGLPVSQRAGPHARARCSPPVDARGAAPPRWNRSRGRPCRQGVRACDPSRGSSDCLPCPFGSAPNVRLPCECPNPPRRGACRCRSNPP